MDSKADSLLPPLPPAPSAPRPYHSYLVRLWQDDELTTWRAVVQSVQTGETSHFADLASLFAFLQRQTVSGPPASAQGP